MVQLLVGIFSLLGWKPQLLALGLLLLPWLGWAQSPHPILESFEANKQPNGILLRWVIAGGNQCNGTKAFRSADGVKFDLVNHIPGICGSTDNNEAYSYFDSVPHPNSYNHYKLEMGFQGFTDVVTVFFEDFGNADHVVLNDTEAGTYRILFSNDSRAEVVLRLFDLSGREVTTLHTRNSDLSLPNSGRISGLHVYRIELDGIPSAHGKLYFGHP